MKIFYDSWKGLFNVVMNTDRVRLHKGGIEARIGALKSKGTGVSLVMCEYDLNDKNRILTHVRFSPINESYDTLKELCLIDETGKGLWRDKND